MVWQTQTATATRRHRPGQMSHESAAEEDAAVGAAVTPQLQGTAATIGVQADKKLINDLYLRSSSLSRPLWRTLSSTLSPRKALPAGKASSGSSNLALKSPCQMADSAVDLRATAGGQVGTQLPPPRGLVQEGEEHSLDTPVIQVGWRLCQYAPWRWRLWMASLLLMSNLLDLTCDP